MPAATSPSTTATALARSYVGILNQGSTCYLNSVIQALFHLPYFRRQIYSITALQQSPLALELRNLFAQLDACSSDITTHELTRAFGWNAYETSFQHDVHEMVQQLFDGLETTLKDTPHANFIRDLFSGFLAFRSRVVDGGGDYVVDRLQRFYDVELVVKDKNNMEESLRELVTPEKIEGVRLELQPGAPATTHTIERSQRFVQLPPVLLVHPNRAAFDMETGEPITLGNRWSFGARIDLAPYVTDPRELRLDPESSDRVQQLRESSSGGDGALADKGAEDEEGEAEQQQQQQQRRRRLATGEGDDGGDGRGSADDDSGALARLLNRRGGLGTRYRLRAILTHAGNMNIGHYYTYIHLDRSDGKTSNDGGASSGDGGGGGGTAAARTGEDEESGAAAAAAAAAATNYDNDDMCSDDGVWLRFNDELVEVASAEEVQRSAFGESSYGVGSRGSGGGTPLPPLHSYFRNERASLLVYVNEDCADVLLRERAQPPPDVLAMVAKLEQQRAPPPPTTSAPAVEQTVRYVCCEDVVDLLDEVPNAMQRARTAPLRVPPPSPPPPPHEAGAYVGSKSSSSSGGGVFSSDVYGDHACTLETVRHAIAAHLNLDDDAVPRVRLLHFAVVPDTNDGVALTPVDEDNFDRTSVFVAQVLPHGMAVATSRPLAQRDGAEVRMRDVSPPSSHHHHHRRRHDDEEEEKEQLHKATAEATSTSSSGGGHGGGGNAAAADDATTPFLAFLRGIREDGSFVLPVRVAHSRAALRHLVDRYIRDEAHGVRQRLCCSTLGRVMRIDSLTGIADGANLLLYPHTLSLERVQQVMETRQHVPKRVMLVDHHNLGVYTPLYTDAVSDYTPYSVMQARVHAWMARHAAHLCPPNASHIAFHYAQLATGQPSVVVARPMRHMYDGATQEEEIGRLCLRSGGGEGNSGGYYGSNSGNNNNNNNNSGNNNNNSNNGDASAGATAADTSPVALLYCSVLPRPVHTLNLRAVIRFNGGWGAQPSVYVDKHVPQLTLAELVAEALEQVHGECMSRELRERCVRTQQSHRHHHHHHHPHHQQPQQHTHDRNDGSVSSNSSNDASSSEQSRPQQSSPRLPMRLLLVQESHIAGVVTDAHEVVDLTQGYMYVLDPLSPELPGYEVVDVQFCTRRSSGKAYFGTPTNISVTSDMHETGHSLLLRVAKKLKVPDAEAVVHKWIICVKGLQTGTMRTAGKSDTLASLVKEVGGKPYCFLVDRPQVVALDGVDDERKEQAIVIRSSSSNELSAL